MCDRDSKNGEYIVTTLRLLRDVSCKSVISVRACFHTACVTNASEVFTWRKGRYGTLGHGDVNYQSSPKRVEALVGVNVEQFACGMVHTAVCTDDDHAHTFDDRLYGQLGHMHREKRTSVPVLVQALEGKYIIQVKCGCDHTIFFTSTGHVFTFRRKDNSFIVIHFLNTHIMKQSIHTSH